MTFRTRIKICGVRRPEDVDAAARCGADAVGLVFYPPSPRAIALADAAALARDLPPFVVPVALFVDAQQRDVDAVIDAIANVWLQFHGAESDAACRAFGRPYVKAIRMRAGIDLAQCATDHRGAKALLVDADAIGHGGGGKAFDWSLVGDRAAIDKPLILAGGLDAANVGDAIEAVRPWAVDVSSGVERLRGTKSADAIQRFCEAVREADRCAASRVEVSASTLAA